MLIPPCGRCWTSQTAGCGGLCADSPLWQVLDLSNNRLRRLPPDIGWLPLRQLNVSHNPDLRTPSKVVLAKGLKAVMSYLQVCTCVSVGSWESVLASWSLHVRACLSCMCVFVRV